MCVQTLEKSLFLLITCFMTDDARPIPTWLRERFFWAGFFLTFPKSHQELEVDKNVTI